METQTERVIHRRPTRGVRIDTAKMTRAREAKGLKRVQLAELVGCTSALIGQIEAGKTHPSPARFRELAAALGMPEDELREQ